MKGAEWYEAICLTAGHRVNDDPPLFADSRRIPELDLQAAWFSGDFGRIFKTVDGNSVEIVQFGVWNREAGPDFAEAAVSIDGKPPVRGAIEIDTYVRDWEHHGHMQNPAYDGVVLHVFFDSPGERVFTRTSANRNVPQVQLNVDDASCAARIPLAKPGRCSGPLQSLTAEAAMEVITAAAQFRFRRKARRLARAAEIHGYDETLFQGLSTSLGYKANKLPFTVIAQRAPLRSLRKRAEASEAILFGIAGFLSEPDLTQYEGDARRYVRELWERWWTCRGEMNRLVLSQSAWRMNGIRPVNHPQRRLAALTQIVHMWPGIRARSINQDFSGIRRLLTGMRHSFWGHHYTLTSDATSRRMALIGNTRITEMLVNVFIPMSYGTDPKVWDAYCSIPAALTNRRVETAATRLFGESPVKPEILKTAACQQGLLQIYEDFCMRDASDCTQCLFPEQLLQFV